MAGLPNLAATLGGWSARHRLTAVGAWLLMVFAGIVGSDVGVHPFGYETSMVVTIALWLTVAPAIGAVARGPGKIRDKKACQ